MPYQAKKVKSNETHVLPKLETEEQGVENTVQGGADLLLSLTKKVSSTNSNRLVVTPPDINVESLEESKSSANTLHNSRVEGMGPPTVSTTSLSFGTMYDQQHQQPRMLYHSPIKICSSTLTSSTSQEHLNNDICSADTTTTSKSIAHPALQHPLPAWSPSIYNPLMHPLYHPAPPIQYKRRQASSENEDRSNKNDVVGKRKLENTEEKQDVRSDQITQQRVISPSSSNEKPDRDSTPATTADPSIPVPSPPNAVVNNCKQPWMYPYGPCPPSMYHHHITQPVWQQQQPYPRPHQPIMPGAYPPHPHYKPMYAPYHHRHLASSPPTAWGMYAQPPTQEQPQHSSPNNKPFSSSATTGTTKITRHHSPSLQQQQCSKDVTTATKTTDLTVLKRGDDCELSLSSVNDSRNRQPAGEDSDEKDNYNKNNTNYTETNSKSFGLEDSLNRCIPLHHPIPKRNWSAASIERKLPDFSLLVNFPDHVSKGRNSDTSSSVADGMKHCVMCGQLRLCSTNNTSISNGGGRRPRSSMVQTTTLSASADDNSLAIGNEKTVHIIPRQNKGVCTVCDVAVWVVLEHKNLEIKWCKGCKNFRPWAAFGDKGLATKCVRCRKRQKEKYATQKITSRTNLYVKQNANIKYDFDDDHDSNIIAANGLRKLMKSSIM